MSCSCTESIDIIARMMQIETGITYPPGRRSYLECRVDSVVKQLGYESIDAVSNLICHGALPDDDLEAIIKAVTVGETWFYRDRAALVNLTTVLLPELIERKVKSGEQHITAWSAACASGPEAYTLAMLLKEAVPEHWSVSVLATDLNDTFVDRGRAGVFSRRVVRKLPPALASRYMRCRGDRCRVVDEIRALVDFRVLNLLGDPYPSPAAGSHFDIVSCSNVLIYFDVETAICVLRRLRRSLSKDGLLVVSAVEAPLAAAAGYTCINQAVCQIFRPGSTTTTLTHCPEAESSTALGTPVEVSEAGRPVPTERASNGPDDPRPDFRAHLVDTPDARAEAKIGFVALANGNLEEARRCAQAGINRRDNLAEPHLLMAAVFEELGEHDAARTCYHRVLVIEPQNFAANLAYANLLFREGRTAAAERRYETVLRLLEDTPDHLIVDPVHNLRADHARHSVRVALEARKHYVPVS